MKGLPPQTLRIAAQTLEYLESNSQPIVHPNDEFLTSFIKDDVHQAPIDTIGEAHLEEEKIEDLEEVIDVEDENEEQEENTIPQLYDRILSDGEKRKMEKVHAKREKDAEKERKRLEREAQKAEKEKEKPDRKMREIVAKLGSMEMSTSAEG
jgi:hypothetical protein